MDEAPAGHPRRRARAGGDLFRHRRRDRRVLPEGHAARQLRLDQQQTGDDIGEPEAERWFYGPSITWSFLDFGRVRQHVKAAEARRDGAIAAYQETVLQGARGNGERARGLPRREPVPRTNCASALEAATEAARLARMRYDVGAGDYLAVLVAERTEARLRGPARAVGDAARDRPRRALQGPRRRSLKRAHDPPGRERREQVLQAWPPIPVAAKIAASKCSASLASA